MKWAIALATAVALVAPRAWADDAEPRFRLSLPTEEDFEAWRQPGFRVQLAYAFGGLRGQSLTPSMTAHSAELRLGVRLDEFWSLYGTFRYAVARGDRSGLRFSGTVEPTFHIIAGLSASLGVGIAGFVTGNSLGEVVPPDGGVVASYTYPTTQPPLGACTGEGVMALARLEYLFVVGSLFSTGPAVQTGLQWTGCRQSLDAIDFDTGEGVELKQFWTHHTWSFSWVLAWR